MDKTLKIFIATVIVIFVISVIWIVIMLFYRPQVILSSKVIYLEPEEGDSVSLCVSDNNQSRSNKVKLATWKEESNWYGSSMYFIIGGAYLNGQKLYYCDIDRKVIVAYDILTGKTNDLESNMLYPFYVNEDGTLFIGSTAINNGISRTYKIVDRARNYEKQFSYESRFNAFDRPLRLIKERYVLFDTALYERSSKLGYFLYDLKEQRYVPAGGENQEYREMDLIALKGDTLAFMNARGKSIDRVVKSTNTLLILDLNTLESRELFHNDNIDIKHMNFSAKGDSIEMIGRMATGEVESAAKPVIISYNLRSNSYLISDRPAGIKRERTSAPNSNIIGYFYPAQK